ncbi:hypothetical protein SRHO_G00009970 [Serrasalmus rhombeus]
MCSPGTELRADPAGPSDHRPPEKNRTSSFGSSRSLKLPGKISPQWLHQPHLYVHQEAAFSHQPHMVPENTSTAECLADPHHHPSQFSPPVTVSLPSVHHLRPHLLAHVLDIAKRLTLALSRCNTFGTVVIHVGIKNISAQHSEVLKEHYQTLLDTARKTPGSSSPDLFPHTEEDPIISAGYSRCSPGSVAGAPLNGLGYVNNRSLFWELPVLYQRDGLCPSPL